MDKISIITICYNCMDDLRMTVESVISQHYPDKEYIIIDGGSTDGTLDVIRQYEEHITSYVSEPDNGIYDALNKGRLRPTPCFDKDICALRLSGIGRFVAAQNILEYRKGKQTHAKR